MPYLSTVTAALAESGCAVKSGRDHIRIRCDGPLKGVRPVRTAPYPTDAQAPPDGGSVQGDGNLGLRGEYL